MSDDETKDVRSKPVAKALAFQKRSADAFSQQRQREIDDLKCQVPANVWPDDVRQARMGSTVGGINIPPRPMLSIPKLDQPVQLQLNQERNAHLGVQVHPISQDANDDTAKVIQGLYRAIEVNSRANLARSWAFDRAVKCGMGWYRVNVVYDEATDDPFDMKVRLDRILRQSSVFPDPFAQEPDFSDGKELLYTSFLSEDDYKAQFGESKLAKYSGDQLADLQADAPFWISDDAGGKSYCVAEYFYTEYRTREWVILEDGSFAFADEMPEGARLHPTTKKTRKVQEPVIKWCKVNAVEELEAGTWNGKYIPFIPAIGKELQTFDSERRWFGIYSTNKDSAHWFNVAVSNAVEVSALEPKAPYIGYVGQFKTNNRQWQLANTRNLPYLEADAVTVNGNLAPLPQRDYGSKNIGPSIAQIEIADNNLQAGTAMYDSLLGKSDRDDPAKKVLALQDQGLAANSHWIANLADISMTHEARVVLDLLPKIYDRPGRVARLIGEDNEQREVVLNAPFQMDPQSKRPQPMDVPEGEPLPKGALQYDLTKGTYGCVVSIGKSYQTRSQQGADAFSQLLMAQPELIKFVGDIWMGFQDFPGHELAAKRLKAAIPPEIANADKEGEEPDAQALQLELQKAEQGAQMMKQIIEEQAKAIETDQIKQQAEMQRSELDVTAKVQIESVKAQLAITLQRMKDEQAVRLERIKQAGAIEEREDSQRHEAAMAGADAAEADKAAERAHEQALESGAVSHQQGMEAQAEQPEASA